MRFNITGETFLPEMVSSFPGAPDLTLGDMLAAAFFYNIIPLVTSFITYLFLYFGIQKIFGRTTTISIIVTGFVLTMTTPLVYILSDSYKPFQYKADVWAWVLCFTFSMTTYFLLNKSERAKGLSEKQKGLVA
ncbi:MAG: hypothetical protein MH132_13065 [Hydrotalea sp.]|nr:hypothetical protein [Hydrotalea sp.]